MPEPRAPRAPEQVEVFSAGPPARPHLDWAIIDATADSALNDASTADLLAELRSKAGEMGCDGLVVGGEFAREDALAKGADRKGMSATCFLYTPLPNTDRAAAAATTPTALGSAHAN